MMLLAATLGAPTTPVPGDWSVKQLQFSAVTIGVAMKDEQTGWSSFTDGGSGIKVTKTTDGGDTWVPVANQTTSGLIMSIDTSATPSLDVVTTGLLGNSYSLDGDHFAKNSFSPVGSGAFQSQSVKTYDGGRVAVAAPGGACLSTDAGATFKCLTVPFKYGKAGRYISWPSSDVIYITAGSWPTDPSSATKKHERVTHLSSNLRVVTRDFETNGGSRTSFEMGPFGERRAQTLGETYTAELWKSADGGATWTSLVTDEGSFYFNDIDCVDEVHCVAVAEGFGHDGSLAPGAKVFATSDGHTFNATYSEDVDGSSLMAVKMLSLTEVHVGGRLEGGLALHTTDGGQTYSKQGASIRGQMITSMSFPTAAHGFATSISQLQICSLLEYGGAAA